MNGFSEKLPEGVDYDDDGYCDDCGAKAIWPSTGEPHYAVCSAGCKTVAINAKAALSALPPQPASPVGAGDVEIVARAIARHHYEEAENCESQFEAGTEDFDSAEEYVEKEWKGWKYFAQAAITAMPRAAQGDADYKALYEQEKAWRSSDNASLTKEIADLQDELNLPNPLNTPECREALGAIREALGICRKNANWILENCTDIDGLPVGHAEAIEDSAEIAFTHLATLEAAVGGKGESDA